MASESEFSLTNLNARLEDEDLTASHSPRVIIFLDPNNNQRLLVVVLGRLDESNLENVFTGKAGQPPASEESMKSLPEVEVSEAGKDCAICLDEFEVGATAKEMPCKHLFHCACVEKWLHVHGTCPICRFKMPVEEKDGGGQEVENGRPVFSVYSFDISNFANDGSAAVDNSSSSVTDDVDN